MRWQQLFADLGAQLAEAEAAADRAESASRTRAEMGAVRLAERLAGAVGHPLVLRCRGAGQVAGALAEVGSDWLLLEEEAGREALVATAAVLAVAGVGRRTAPPDAAGLVRGRFDLRRAARALARDRSTVRILLEDGSALTGTIDRVGADFLELAAHAPDESRRQGAVRAVYDVALGAVAVIRTAPPGLG